MLLGAVGQLQFEVVQHRLKAEYDADVRLEGCQYTGARWITADTPAELRAFTDAYPRAWRATRPTRWPTCAPAPYDVRLAQERFPEDPLPSAARARRAGTGQRGLSYCGLANPSFSTSAFSFTNVSCANFWYCALLMYMGTMS
jgi:hypothetical protein